MVDYYDKDGRPIDLFTWARLLENQDYKHVALTIVTSAADPAHTHDVSTIWLGLNHNVFGIGPPVIFETMVFGTGSVDMTCHRYSTQEQAETGHQEMVTLVASTMDDPVIMERSQRD